MKKQTGAQRGECELIFNAFIEEIANQTMNERNSVLLSGFGTFSVQSKSQRVGRNPKTGVSAIIPARRKLSFSASEVFRDQIAAIKNKR